MTLNEALNQHQAEVNILNRRYRIMGGATPQAVREGHRKHGTAYMSKLIHILKDANLSDYNPDMDETQQGAIGATAQPPGKFWNFLDNFLTGAVKTSGAYARVRSDIYGNPLPQDQNYFAAQKQNNILWIGAFVAIVIVLIIIFKK